MSRLFFGLLLLMGVSVMPIQLLQQIHLSVISSEIMMANGADYSREAETCINLRGCGRRGRT